MELFLLSNGKLADDAPLLGYAQPQLHAMIARRAIRSAVLIPTRLFVAISSNAPPNSVPHWAFRLSGFRHSPHRLKRLRRQS